MNKLVVALASLLLLSSLMLPLTVPSVRAQPTDINLLVVDTIGEPMDIDPAWSYDTASAELLMNTYETLLWFNRTETGEYTPILATEWNWVEGSGKLSTGEILTTSPEGLEWAGRWEFKINTAATFHDDGVSPKRSWEGKAITTEDIEHTFERILLTDCSTGPAWMIFEPLVNGYWMGDVNATCFDNGVGSLNEYGWNTECDEMIDHVVERNATHVWFNLMLPEGYPFLQIVAQQWGSILCKDWCTDTSISGHEYEWPGMQVGDKWIDYWDPDKSPLYYVSTAHPGLHLDAVLGTGPYMFNYWDTGAGGSWSVVKNDNYWRGWDNYDGLHPVHVNEFQSWYIPEWPTRRLRFLGGICDFCAVPRMYMTEVLGQPGIDCMYPLTNLACDAAFFTFLVSSTSARMGAKPLTNATLTTGWSSTNSPVNIFNFSDVRLAFVHAFDYDSYLEAAMLDEAFSPTTPILDILAPNVPQPGQPEDPVKNTRKKLGVSYELSDPAIGDTNAYNLTLAAKYLQKVSGLWASGFTMDFVYNEGNLMREMAARILKDGLEEISATVSGAPTFTITVTMIPWSVYKLEWKAYNLPYFIVGWLADFPDAHNFAHPFMHSIGAFSRWQGFMGVTEFPTQQIDDLIADGIAKTPREPYYEQLNQIYVDMSPGFPLQVPTGRHFQRDWVDTGATYQKPGTYDPLNAPLWNKTQEGKWYFNPIYPGEYVYDLWKKTETAQELDVGIESITPDATGTTIWLEPYTTLMHDPLTFTIAVKRYDTTGPFEDFVVGLQRVNLMNGYTTVVNMTSITSMGPSGTISVELTWNETTDTLGPADSYRIGAVVYPTHSYVSDTNMANNILNDGTVTVTLFPDCNADGSVDGSDFFVFLQAWGTSPPSDPSADFTGDGTVDGSDFFVLLRNWAGGCPPS